jgi:phosphoribosylformylglycinamidine cyclo-ligase/phosphoribosylamine--glycine ligase/phosphoribosylformylglycinamidine cyclo-ligase
MKSLYEQAGVSIEAGQEAVDLIAEAVASTHTAHVLAGVGAFGGLFSLAGLEVAAPVLVASTDGVGTKVKLAAALGQYESMGQDIVNHCLNDIMCAGQGVRPLFFLDYIASSQLKPAMVAEIVAGMAAACRAAGCALLGGETAEMPGVYQPGEFDVVGTIVGVVDKNRCFPRPDLQAGDAIIGLPSSGPHTNGYSLIRSIFADTPLETEFEGIGPLGQALLAPHRSYVDALARLQAVAPIKALAHITGGGLVENPPRALRGCRGLTLRLKRGTWPVPPLFRLIQVQGGVSDEEMVRVFNMGIGMIAMVAAEAVPAALAATPGWLIGEVIAGEEMEWG